MTMTEEYVTYQQAKALKECGFDWECDHYYFRNNETLRWCYPADDYFQSKEFYSAPRLSSAQKWLREVKSVHVLPTLESVNQPYYVCRITQMRRGAERITDNTGYFNTYEAALSAGIDAALELIKQK